MHFVTTRDPLWWNRSLRKCNVFAKKNWRLCDTPQVCQICGVGPVTFSPTTQVHDQLLSLLGVVRTSFDLTTRTPGLSNHAIVTHGCLDLQTPLDPPLFQVANTCKHLLWTNPELSTVPSQYYRERFLAYTSIAQALSHCWVDLAFMCCYLLVFWDFRRLCCLFLLFSTP